MSLNWLWWDLLFVLFADLSIWIAIVFYMALRTLAAGLLGVSLTWWIFGVCAELGRASACSHSITLTTRLLWVLESWGFPKLEYIFPLSYYLNKCLQFVINSSVPKNLLQTVKFVSSKGLINVQTSSVCGLVKRIQPTNFLKFLLFSISYHSLHCICFAKPAAVRPAKILQNSQYDFTPH